jgi:hypothetical protein
MDEHGIIELRRAKRKSVHDRHREVEQNHIRREQAGAHERRRSVWRGANGVTFERQGKLEKIPAVRIIIHDENRNS